MHYLKIIFILSSLFIFNPSLASLFTCKKAFEGIPEKIISSQRSVWKIKNFLPFGGTGFFISPNQFVTNFHVIGSLHKISLQRLLPISDIKLKQKGTFKKFKIKKIQKLSALYDLAILEIDGEVTNYLPLELTSLTETEKEFFLTGYPTVDGFRIIKLEKLPYENEIKYKFHFNYDSILDGVSGSPVLNEEGGVIGVAFAGSNKRKHLLAVKTKFLKNLLLEEQTEIFSNS